MELPERRDIACAAYASTLIVTMPATRRILAHAARRTRLRDASRRRHRASRSNAYCAVQSLSPVKVQRIFRELANNALFCVVGATFCMVGKPEVSSLTTPAARC